MLTYIAAQLNSNMISFYLLSAILITLKLLVLFKQSSSSTRDSSDGSGILEPSVATPPIPIPVIGHLIGLSRWKYEYYGILSQKVKSPIFTLLLPGQKVYVVTTPDLIQAVQKQHKLLNFTPIESKFAASIVQPSQEAIDILNRNLGDKGEWGVHVDNRVGMREGTAPGPQVDKMNREMVGEVSRYLDHLAPPEGGVTSVRLYAWLKDNLTTATTNAVYGPHNPYKHPETTKAFWLFESNLLSLILMPNWLSKKPANARDQVGRAFEDYFAREHHKEASLLTRNRWDAMLKNGIPWKDRSKFEVAGSLAFLVNTIPAAFWLLFRIYSTPGLLQEMRGELDAVMRVETNHDTSEVVRNLDITIAKGSCPLLLSAYQETLRQHTMGMSVREVTEDMILRDRHSLKKGAMIHMPMRVIHTDPAVWGSDANEFRPRRFIRGEKHSTPGGTAPKDVCFRAFGGGKTLCPGRHFATNEIIAVVAMFVSRFDMRPAKDQGWKLPTGFNTSVASAVMVPDWDVDVAITRRAGFENGSWHISLSDSNLVLALTAEDRN